MVDATTAGEMGSPRQSSSDRIVRDIKQGMYEGRFVAGQRLAEPDLMRLYEVGRSTVREALQRLAAEGVVTVTAHRGAQVRHLSRAEARDLLQLLEVTIGLAARLAALRIREPGMREQFIKAYEGLAAFAGREDSYDLVRARNRFYHAMNRVGGNGLLGTLIDGFNVHLIRTYLRRPSQERFADYRAMADAILAGDGGRAEIVARRHLRNVMTALDEAPDSIFAPGAPTQPQTT